MKSMKKRLGLESIQYQNKNKGKELELLISEFRKKNFDSLKSQKSKDVKIIEETILKLFGLNIQLITNTNVLAAIELPLVHLNHIFFKEELKDFIINDIVSHKKKVSKTLANTTVDIKNAFISGYFSTVRSKVYLSWNLLLSLPKFSDEEVTAILLHELGHGFTTFEYMNRFVATNQALAAISTSLLNNDKVTEYEYLLRSTGKEFLNDEKRFDSLKEVKDNKVVIPFILSTIIKETKSDLGTRYYDKVSCEYLADQFVSRLQYGKAIVTGLNKMYGRAFPDKTPWMQIVYDIVGVLILGGTAILMAGGLNVFAIATGLLLTFQMLNSSGFTNFDFTYDHLKVRFTRIREQLINDLKSLNYSPSEISEKIKDLNEINKAIDETFVAYPWATRLMKFLFPFQKRAEEKYLLQRTLEELASNNLFVQSAKLRSLQT